MRYSSLIIHVAALSAIVMGVLLVQRVAQMDPVFDSVAAIGERAGRVLPQGVNNKSRHKSNLRVTIRPVTASPLHVRDAMAGPVGTEALARNMADLPMAGMTTGPAGLRTEDRTGIDARVAGVMAGPYIAALLIVGRVRWRRDVRGPWGLTLGQISLAAGVCVVGGGLVSLMRVFWTGVDRAFYERSLVRLPGSSTIRVRGDELLSMSASELVLMVVAAVLTAAPFVLAIAARAGLGDDVGSNRGSLTRWLHAQRAVSDRMSERSLRWVALICYVLLTGALWSAPWSTTMAEALWG